LILKHQEYLHHNNIYNALQEKRNIAQTEQIDTTEEDKTLLLCIYHINLSLPLAQDLIHLSAAFKFNGAG
jgi:hypothetical protein